MIQFVDFNWLMKNTKRPVTAVFTLPAALLLLLVTTPLQAPASNRGLGPLFVAISAPSYPPAALASSNHDPWGRPLAVWECVSSWYGESFDGRITANGETFSMYASTAAHPTLPLGSVVRVVNLRTRRSTVVRINDRGPYVENRGLDVSYQVARQLGFDQHGLARVRLELLEVPPRPATAALIRAND